MSTRRIGVMHEDSKHSWFDREYLVPFDLVGDDINGFKLVTHDINLSREQLVEALKITLNLLAIRGD